MPTLVDDDPAVPPEGSLLPETYMTPRGMTHSAVLAQMAAAQDALLDEYWPRRDPDIPVKTRQEAIILASVVEKETGVGMERGKVAGVFTNRLRRGMRLQSDPTIIYGISRGEILRRADGTQRPIFQSEIDRRTDWNTYQIDGLPRTPICNPGRDAILRRAEPGGDGRAVLRGRRHGRPRLRRDPGRASTQCGTLAQDTEGAGAEMSQDLDVMQYGAGSSRSS